MKLSAKEVLILPQKIIFLILLIIFIVGLAFTWQGTIIFLLGVLTLFYLANIFLGFYLSFKSVFQGEEIVISPKELSPIDWPTYTILCPLYKEANILPKFVSNISNLDYPKEKLECLLLLEENDEETLRAAKLLNLPSFFKIIIVKDSYPKTKPKACNVGLLNATGEYTVIYDAEDRPDKDQLKKAVLAFKKAGLNVACIQAKLNFYNQKYNFLTRMFTSEYTLWFDLILPGFQAIDAPIPLGGTSNHFKTAVLKKLGGWDPYNVTEDCDLGLRLKESGHRTLVLDSTTWEEANSELKNWIRQRSRWIKGYLQTYLVHSRQMNFLLKKIGPFNTFLFSLWTGFLPLTALINPLLWALTISYFTFRPEIGQIIEALFPPYILYPGVFCLVIGNFFFLYNYLLASSKKGFDEFVKYGLLMPIYWIMISFAGWYGIVQLIFRPHFWEKTNHGLALSKGGVNV